MSYEIVQETEIGKIEKDRQKYFDLYKIWFAKVFELKEGEVIKIVLEQKSTGTLPSPAAARFAVQRHNLQNPTKRIGQTLRKARSNNPVLYLYPEKVEESEKSDKKSIKAGS